MQPGHRRLRVHEPRTELHVRPGRPQVRRGRKDPRDSRLPAYAQRHEQRRHPRHVRRGLRGPGQLVVAAVVPGGQDVLVRSGHARPARRDEAQPRAEARVEAAVLALVHGAHAEHLAGERVVLAERQPVVARGRHHHHAVIHGSLYGGRHRVLQAEAGSGKRRSEAQVDHVGAVGGGPVDSRRNVGVRPRSAVVQHPDGHDGRAGRDAVHADAVAGICRDDARHVGAVAVAVLRRRVARHEVPAGPDPACQVGMRGVDAGVHHRHRGARAGARRMGRVGVDQVEAPLLRAERIRAGGVRGRRDQRCTQNRRDPASRKAPHAEAV